MTTTKLAAHQCHNGMFRISYDGVVMGDDRAFPTKELAEYEIQKRLQKDAREAVIYARPILYSAA